MQNSAGIVSVVTITLVLSAGPQAQIAKTAKTDATDKVEYIKSRLAELYGKDAPADITFVLPTKPKYDAMVEARGKTDARAKMENDAYFPKGITKRTKEGDQSETAYVGDVVRGVIVGERDGEMFLDKDPCKGHIVPFTGNYRKTKLGTVTCGGNVLDRYEVAQK